MRVIVIEDDEHFRSLTLRWLQTSGIEAEGAAHGARGLALQRQRPADVIVTDIFMPEMEGMETINDLRREFPEAKIIDRKSTRLNSSHSQISYAVFCLKK